MWAGGEDCICREGRLKRTKSLVMELKPISISKETSRRMAVMSFVCACLIVLIHCTPAPDKSTWQWWVANLLGANGLCRIAVPWFFVASAFFLAGRFGETSWYSNAVKKRVRTLLVPFVIWAMIGLLFHWLMWYGIQKAGYVCGVQNPMANGILPGLVGALGFDPSRMNIGPIWYLRMLFALVLVSPLICWATLRFRCAVPVVLLLGYGVYDSVVHFTDFWEYVISLRGIAYFSVGVAVRFGMFCGILGVARRMQSLTFMLAAVSLLVNMIARYYGATLLENLSDFLMVPLLMGLVWRSFTSVRLPVWCTTNAFALYVMHGTFLFISIAVIVAFRLRPMMDGSVALAFMRWVFAIGTSLILAQAIKKLCPGTARILFGGR